MKTTFNSSAIRNEVIEMQSQNTQVSRPQPMDKAKIGLIALFVTLIVACVVLNQCGLITNSNAY